MSRVVVLIVVILVLVGALVFLSSVPEEQPTRVIEVEVPQGGNAQ